MIEEEEKGYTWETEYERTWEALREDQSGSVEMSVIDMVNRAKRKRLMERHAKIRLGIMRHVFVVVDFSVSMLEKDLPPSRLQTTLRLLEGFIDEFFDHNPIGQLAFVAAKNKRAEKLSELSGNSRKHIEVIRKAVEIIPVGEMSLQNSLELCLNTLKHLPSHTSREVLVVMASLNTCDPGNVNNTIEVMKTQKIRCSVISLAAEVYVCKRLCSETGGSFSVILDETHFKDLLSAFTLPPPTLENFDSNMVKMGFPGHRVTTNTLMSMCACHMEDHNKKYFTDSGYFCPQCQAKYCELPVECKICGLTLVSAPHLARSYHQLLPIDGFVEHAVANDCRECFACDCKLEHKSYGCTHCGNEFCIDCDLFIHETLNTCPGCHSVPTVVTSH